MPTRLPVVLALPGLLSDRVVWGEVATALDDVVDMVIVDRAHGDDLGAMATAALATVAGPVHVVGHSMGGRIALEIWRLAPDRVQSLVLMDTGTHGVRPGEAAARAELTAMSARDGMGALAEAWLPGMVAAGRRDDPTVVGPLREMVGRFTPAEHAAQIDALLTRHDTTDLLPTISVPTLVIVGRHDEWSPPAQHDVLAAAIPGARLEVVEDAGHFVTVEQPAAVVALLREWFAVSPAPRGRG
jgi:pimeloyl-ACP methyl ester carboxylesterase